MKKTNYVETANHLRKSKKKLNDMNYIELSSMYYVVKDELQKMLEYTYCRHRGDIGYADVYNLKYGSAIDYDKAEALPLKGIPEVDEKINELKQICRLMRKLV